jgi:hypothetical protein
MTDDRSFLTRWSRRKRGAAPDRHEQPKPENAGSGVTSEACAPSVSAGEVKPPFDLASLPPTESIGAGSDIRAFPPACPQTGACRASPRLVAIRDFVGLSKNSWTSMRPAQCRASDRLTRRKLGAL